MMKCFSSSLCHWNMQICLSYVRWAISLHVEDRRELLITRYLLLLVVLICILILISLFWFYNLKFLNETKKYLADVKMIFKICQHRWVHPIVFKQLIGFLKCNVGHAHFAQLKQLFFFFSLIGLLRLWAAESKKGHNRHRETKIMRVFNHENNYAFIIYYYYL